MRVRGGIKFRHRFYREMATAIGVRARRMSGLGQEMKKSGFFAIESRKWAALCGLGRMNEAIAYLVQARGTGRDNRTTAWSVQAIENYTGISRHRAAAAVKTLQAAGFVRLVRGGSRPLYELMPYADACRVRRPLGPVEQRAVDLVGNGTALDTVSERQAAYRAVVKGWLTRDETRGFAVAPEPKPDLIWLPNALVTGAAGETAPVELVRQTQDPMMLRLLIDMYREQNLREDGGVSRHCVWQKYERFEIGESAQFVVWGFRRDKDWVNWGNELTAPHRRKELTKEEKAAGENTAVDFFRRIGQLRDSGLIEWVPHLVESTDPSGEIIHPLAMGDTESVEDRLGRAASAAGGALITDGQRDRAANNGIQHLVPVLRHLVNVQVVGIARLRYRAHTNATAAWWAALHANAEKHLARYAALAACETTAAAMQPCSIKV
jgi:hypothetical protein